MGKKKFSYVLVGSVYEQGDKNYSSEEIITLPEIEDNSLEAIDFYTTGEMKSDFVSNLPEKYRNKNSFSIRVTNNQTGRTYHVKTIFDNFELHEEISNIRKRTVNLDAGYQTLSLLPVSDLVDKSWLRVKEALANKDMEVLGSYFSPNSTYYFKLNRYLNSTYDYGQEEQVLDNLYTEFRDYHIFRKAYVAQQGKVKNLRPKASKKSDMFSQPMIVKRPEFGTDYVQQQVVAYNTRGEKEEFLEPDEILEFQDFQDDGYEAYSHIKKKEQAKVMKKKRSSRDEY